ncbi:MAG: hypothetical protein KIT23_07600 [Sphingopyxis sp.]|nr:hypothetical protein [Sphingopyxis sp.]
MIAATLLVPTAQAREMTQEKMDKIMAAANKEYERQERERVREQLRDKTHDNRLKVGKDSSVGVTRNGGSFIWTFP